MLLLRGSETNLAYFLPNHLTEKKQNNENQSSPFKDKTS